jgi:hypothetical protein
MYKNTVTFLLSEDACLYGGEIEKLGMEGIFLHTQFVDVLVDNTLESS